MEFRKNNIVLYGIQYKIITTSMINILDISMTTKQDQNISSLEIKNAPENVCYAFSRILII